MESKIVCECCNKPQSINNIVIYEDSYKHSGFLCKKTVKNINKCLDEGTYTLPKIL